MTYKEICDEELLFKTMLECRKGVSWKHSVQSYTLRSVANIARLAETMRAGIWNFPKHRRFLIKERGKVRSVNAASMDERIAQKAVCQNVLIPLLSRSFIHDNGAVLKGKGTAFSRRRIVQHLRGYQSRFGGDGYALIIDIKSYFASINHAAVIERLSRTVSDDLVLKFVRGVMEKGGRGLSLGSEVSQILAVWFLSVIDHFCKEVLRLKYYARHMDDIYAIHPSKLYLAECMEKIQLMLSSLGLEANERKTMIVPLSRGFTFLKVHYTISESGRIGRRYGRDSGRRMRRRLRAFGAKGKPPREVRNEYQSWRRSLKNLDADTAIKLTDASYRQYILKGERI